MENRNIENMVQAYLNNHLRRDVEWIVRDMEKEDRKTLGSFLFDHEGLAAFGFIVGCLIALAVVFIVGLTISYNLEIGKLNESARICKETGYGCKSDTKNTDIQYHDTPILDVEVKNGTN